MVRALDKADAMLTLKSDL